MPGVEVIVPFLGGCQHREAAWTWVRRRHTFPTVEATGGHPWCKATAVMPAIARSSADIIVVSDADVWTDGLTAAVQAVRDGASWAIPHRMVYRLTHAATERLLVTSTCDGEEPSETVPLDAKDTTEEVHEGLAGGGIIVAHRTALLTIPLDPRFIGWGQEDESWANALDCLLGPAWRGDAPLLHLWHPAQQRITRKRGSHASWQLRRRYWKAHYDPARMRELLEEAHAALAAPQHALHDHA